MFPYDRCDVIAFGYKDHCSLPFFGVLLRISLGCLLGKFLRCFIALNAKTLVNWVVVYDGVRFLAELSGFL